MRLGGFIRYGPLQMSSILRKKYEVNWEILDVLLGGKSIIDTQDGLTGFPIHTAEDADRFLKSYGYDLSDPIESAEALGNFHEAINFIRSHFLRPENPEGLDVEIPRKILELTDVRDLILYSCFMHPGQMRDSMGTNLRNWACSVLKVIHAIAHIDKDVRSAYFTDIQQQIFDEYYKLILRDEDGNLFLGKEKDDPLKVDLVGFETKPKKSRDSTLLKLLHKPESVADDIFDRVGIRFVTKNRLDAFRVVKYLKDAMVVMPANIKTSRSRNSLIEFSYLQETIDAFLKKLDDGEEIQEEDLAQNVEDWNPAPQYEDPSNPHSSEFYRAIQFTARKLIKLKNPLYEEIRELKKATREAGVDEEIAGRFDRLDLSYLQREVRFFYPYEVQVLDEKSADENEKGKSAHSEYKKAQLLTALRRVMGSLVDDLTP